MASSVKQLGTGFDANVFESQAISLIARVFKPLDELLRCHICFEYFTNCMITKCSHNYCSLCIRRYMSYKSQCPTCFQAATEPELQNNRLIDEILRVYKKIRESLQIPFESVDNLCLDLPSSSKAEGCYNSKRPSKMNTSAYVESSKSGTQKKTEISTFDEVTCPVCYTTVPGDKINSHLDNCLKQSEDRNERKFLPKLVYHLLSDKDIRKKLKDHGLNTSGDRQTLIRRHKNFVLLYNANCDSLNPKPVSELLIEIDRQELEERVNAASRTAPVSKRSDPSVLEKKNESYVQEHKSQFNALMLDVQQREISKAVIKKDDDVSAAVTTSRMLDNSGNKIGETSVQIGKPQDLEALNVKQEVSDSSPSSPSDDDSLSDSDKNVRGNTVVPDKKCNEGKESSNKPLPFRIRKEVPIRLKGASQSLLDMSDDDSSTDSLSSLEDFRARKVQTRSCLKKKNVRKLSVGDGSGSQRKK